MKTRNWAAVSYFAVSALALTACLSRTTSNSTSSLLGEAGSAKASVDCAAIARARLAPSPQMLFADNFNYVAGRDDIAARDAFVAHNWTGIKSVQTDPNRNPRGHLYTENDRLAIESHANGFSGQTDFWLQLGSETVGAERVIPAKLKIEFDYEVDAASVYDRHDKFFYPGRGGYPQTASYDPITGAVVSSTYLWLLGTSTSSMETNTATPIELGAQAEHFLFLRSPYASFTGALGSYLPDREKLFPNLNTAVRINPGSIHHVIFQIDTSTVCGSFEMWIDGVKTHEWIDGVTPNFTWRIPEQLVGGHSVMRIPTTLSGGESKSWIDNFWMGSY